jgi:MFS transporter, Spinster family, sphingosine-1-phosphate transporter
MIRNRIAIVAVLTGLNLFNYLDRALVAAVLLKIRTDLDLSGTEGGLLGTVFLVGYFLTAPLFGSLGDWVPRKYLLAGGVVLWSLATVASGLSNSLLTLVMARAAVGVGEAAYATLAPTIIDDITPEKHKGKMLSIFFLALPLGTALGFVFGGLIANQWGWRAAFFIGGGPGIALAVLCLLLEEPARKIGKAKPKIVHSARTLLKIPIYRRAVIGYCAHTAAIGAFIHWGPDFLESHYGLSHAATVFGAITLIAGAVGTLLGGRWTDRVLSGVPPVPADAPHDHIANRITANAQLRVCALGVAIAFPLATVAFLMPSATGFFVLAGVCVVGLMLSTSPINAILLRTAPSHLRASAMAVAIFAIHLFGDLWSQTALGWLRDVLPDVIAMMALPFGFMLAAIVWWPRKREAT